MLAFTFFLLCLIVPQNTTPPQSHFLEVKVENQALLGMMQDGKKFNLPQLRVYNQKGFQVADFGSGEDDTFPATLTKVLQSPPKENGKTLES